MKESSFMFFSYMASAMRSSDSFLLLPDLLPKFPPNSVQMRVPFGLHPWNSSPEPVKKLFKVRKLSNLALY